MAGVAYTKLIQLLDSIGVDTAQQAGKNTKKAFTGGKSTAMKPGILVSERGAGGNFDTVLNIFKDEAKYIDTMNDVEQMAFLNNVMDYKEFGGKSISSSKRTAGPELVEDSFSYTDEAAKDIDSIEDAQFGLNSLNDSLLESRDTVKSLREEMKIAYRKSFDKLTGDETAAELKDMLKNLDIDGVPFAQGGRASFAGGKIIDEIILMLTKKEPMEAMKEVNKIIGKKGKYKNLTQKDIDRIVDQSNDHIFQRDPDNLFVEDRPMFKQETDDVDLSQGMIDLDELNFTSNAKAAKEAIDNTSVNKEIKEGVAEIMSDTSPEALKASIEIDNLMLKYPGMDKLLARQIATDTNPKRKSDVIAMVEQTFELNKQGKSGDEIIDIFKKGTDRTKQADGGITRLRNGYYGGSSVDHAVRTMDPVQDSGHKIDKVIGAYKKYRRGEKNPRLSFNKFFELFSAETFATGGRAGYYGGGITNMIEPDLSDIGHGAEAMNARTRVMTPGSQATTSTGLSYLLGEDNDTTRVPYNEGNMVLPKPKPPADPMIELKRIYDLYAKAGPGVSQETKKFLQQDFIQKLNEANVSQEAFMTDRMQKNFKAEGGRIGFAGGGGMGRRGFLKLLGGSVATVTAFKTGLIKMLGKDSGAVTKKALDKFIVQEGAGAPAWLEPLVNKALKEGTDKTKALAIADGQIVKSLDTPTGNVDVYYDTRTGAVDIDYIGSGTTTMDEPLQMSYKPGVADEGTKGIKPDDEFSAVESIPEINQSSGNFSGSHKDLEFGENVSNNVEGLYSDTSELAKLGGKNPLIKEISESIQKKKFLKKMNDDPQQFAMENVSEYYD